MIAVTPADVHRITGLTGMSPEEFLTLIEPDDSVIRTYKDSPKIRFKDRNNFVLVLPERNDGCMFLNNNSCSIYRSRPSVCRPFPFEYSIEKRGKVVFDVNEEARSFCKGLGSGSRSFDFAELERSVLERESQRRAFVKRVKEWNTKGISGAGAKPTMSDLLKFLLLDN